MFDPVQRDLERNLERSQGKNSDYKTTRLPPWEVSPTYFLIAVSDCGPVVSLTFIIIRLVGAMRGRGGEYENTPATEDEAGNLGNHELFEKAVT